MDKMTALLNNMDINPKIKSEKYFFNGKVVPRVTEILSAMLHEDYLMQWSNSLGFRRMGYKKTLQLASDIGTYSHNSVEKFLINGAKPDLEQIPIECRKGVSNAFNSFLMWMDMLKKNNCEFKVLELEKELVCEWFGGTMDALFEINKGIYLFDFKTSNHLSYKYFLQLAAYCYILETYRNISIDGICILRLDKHKCQYYEYMLDMHNEEHKKYINNCLLTFFSLVYSYYNRLNIEEQYKILFGGNT